MQDLNLGLIGNCAISALIDPNGSMVWSCFPRIDGDPIFCGLLQPRDAENGRGAYAVELKDFSHSSQSYETNTAVLVTQLFDQHGGSIALYDFAPRFHLHGRVFHPQMLIRQIRRLAGAPRIRVKLKPVFDYGQHDPRITWGSHHISYASPNLTVRLTTDASITHILEERSFYLDDTLTLLLGPDETLDGAVGEIGSQFLQETSKHWREWVRSLSTPVDWQEAVIRAAITLKLNAFDDTGAIVAAMTTSIPEHANSGRNWDYRYCWLRDGYFVVNALNRLGATTTMENFLGYLLNVSAEAAGEPLQPVYGISGAARLTESQIDSLAGYRGMGPVRVGNQAYEQIQHDVYGATILAATHMFFDHRLLRRGDADLFHQLEPLGELALAHFDQPDAGIWELRGKERVHTYSSVLCWAACDRLARIAERLGIPEAYQRWRDHADRLHSIICKQAWNEQKQGFCAYWGGDALDASLLLLHELGFLSAEDSRFASTVGAIEKELRHGDFIFRYVEQDDFGTPENAFLVCTFWYVYALHALGRRDEAIHIFERLLACCTPLGLLAEDVNTETNELWGNFVQTYSMVGLINCALRLSRRWDQAY